MNNTGLVAAAVVLVLGTGIGLWRRHTDGRLRAEGPAASRSGDRQRTAASSTAAGAAVSPPDAAARAPSGDDRSDAVPSSAAGGPDGHGVVAGRGVGAERIDPALLAELGVRPAGATLLQFSSAFCAPCRAVRRVSSEVAALLPDVQHVEVDAESHLDAVRALGIWRTPTLLVLDADGRVAKRATGVPGKAQLIAVLGELLPEA